MGDKQQKPHVLRPPVFDTERDTNDIWDSCQFWNVACEGKQNLFYTLTNGSQRPVIADGHPSQYLFKLT